MYHNNILAQNNKKELYYLSNLSVKYSGWWLVQVMRGSSSVIGSQNTASPRENRGKMEILGPAVISLE